MYNEREWEQSLTIWASTSWKLERYYPISDKEL